jgi:alpha-ketoglutarate-dependent taurine dioxygenase
LSPAAFRVPYDWQGRELAVQHRRHHYHRLALGYIIRLGFFYRARPSNASPCVDFSFELQPPGLTTFFLLSQPKTGGDTLYSSQVKNLRTLSPIMQDFLRTLKATHSGFDSLRSTKGGVLRRDPIETIHPVVRRHPVTGEEALYVNKQFTRRIVGMKREESG